MLAESLVTINRTLPINHHRKYRNKQSTLQSKNWGLLDKGWQRFFYIVPQDEGLLITAHPMLNKH
jgi:hypothetical protein